MKKSKIIVAILFFVVCAFSLSNIYAVSVYDVKAQPGVYKVSEDDSEFDIPFFRFSKERMEIDSPISQVGAFFTEKDVEVTAPLQETQAIFTKGTVRINSNVGGLIIFSTGNVIINGTLEKPAIIYATGDVTISKESLIGDNLICYCNTLEVNGLVEKNILGATANLRLNSVVQGKVKMAVEDVVAGENAYVGRGLEINTTNKNLTIDETIGTVKIDMVEGEEQVGIKGYIYSILFTTIGSIVIYILILIFAKKERLEVLVDKLQDRSKDVLKNGVISYLGLIVMLSFSIVLIVALLKLSVSMMIFSISTMVIMTLLKNVIFGTFIIELAAKKYKDSEMHINRVVLTLVTFLLLEILEVLPFIGELVKFAVFIISLGIVITLILNNKKTEIIEPDKKVIKAE